MTSGASQPLKIDQEKKKGLALAFWILVTQQ